MSTFDTALDVIWASDRDGHQHDDAPGETFHTAWGVTQMTWDAAVEHGIVSGGLQDATRDQCAAIYRANYWNALRCDSFPAGAALVMFVDATLTGVGHVARMVQRAVGAAEDGVIGRETVSRAAGFTPGQLVNMLCDADEKYLATLANAPKFLHGWTRREEALRAAALDMSS